MAEDREQKIRDVYEALRKVREQQGTAILTKLGSERLREQARAAVDVLDPVERVELSGGFYAEPAPADPSRYNVFHERGATLYKDGNLSKEAVEAWAAAAKPGITTTKTEARLRMENEELHKRIATLARIMEAMQSAEALDAIKALRP